MDVLMPEWEDLQSISSRKIDQFFKWVHVHSTLKDRPQDYHPWNMADILFEFDAFPLS